MLKVKRLTDTAKIPTRAHANDVGLDLYADTEVFVPARGRKPIPLGIAVEIPVGYVGSIRPRSGLAMNHGLAAVIGTVDPGYRGEVKALLVNHSDHHFEIKPGMRVAQLVLELCAVMDPIEVPELSNGTERGAKGFGSSGA